MELKLETKSMISSVLYTRLLEMWTQNKNAKRKLLSKIPSEDELDDYVFGIRHYASVRQAYIEFCNECEFDVDLTFEYPEVDEDRFYREHCPDEADDTEKDWVPVTDASFEEDEE